MADEIDDVMAAVGEAFDEAVKPEPEATPEPEIEAAPEPEVAPDVEETAAEKSARERDEAGRFKKGAKGKTAASPEGVQKAATVKAAAAVQGKAAEAAPDASAAPPVPQPLKAPQSLRPASREFWAKLTANPEAKAFLEDIQRREAEVPRVLQETAQARQMAAQVQQSLAPYESIARANGMDAMTFAGNALQDISAIYSGAPNQAVAVVAGAVQMLQQRFGPQALEMINAAIEGKATPQGAQPMQPPRDPRVDQLFQQLEQAKAQRAQAAQAQTQQMLESFASSHEFFDDVREEMANLIDVWGKTGRVKGTPTQHDLERAYDLSCRSHEEVSKVLEQRKAAEAARTAAAATQRARAAGVSVRPSPATQHQSRGSSGSIEDDVRSALDEVASR